MDAEWKIRQNLELLMPLTDDLRAAQWYHVRLPLRIIDIGGKPVDWARSLDRVHSDAVDVRSHSTNPLRGRNTSLHEA